MKLTVATLFFAVCLASAAALAQATAPSPTTAASTAAPTKDPVTAAVKMILPQRQKNILAAIDAMPAE